MFRLVQNANLADEPALVESLQDVKDHWGEMPFELKLKVNWAFFCRLLTSIPDQDFDMATSSMDQVVVACYPGMVHDAWTAEGHSHGCVMQEMLWRLDNIQEKLYAETDENIRARLESDRTCIDGTLQAGLLSCT